MPWTYPTWVVLAGLGKKQRECLSGWGAQSLPAVLVYMDQNRGEGLLIGGQVYPSAFRCAGEKRAIGREGSSAETLKSQIPVVGGLA